MRSTRLRLLSAAVVPLFVAAGCASDGSDAGADDTTSPTTTSTDTESATDPPEATGSIEDVELEQTASEQDEDVQVPAITLPETPFAVSDTDLDVLTEGEGEDITVEQDVTIRYMAVNGTSGDEVLSTFPTDESVVMELGNEGLPEGLREALVGQKPGAELLVAVPPAEGFPNGYEALGIAPEDTVVFYIEAVSAEVPLTQAEGEEVEPAEGLPTVEFDPEAAATITIPEGEDPPEELVVQPLIEGEGPEVEAGQTITAHYTGVLWRNGEVFDSSLPRGEPSEFPIGVGSVIEGWDEGLVGQPVGSRVLLVTPPEVAYPEGQGEIQPDDTLVFVVDILKAQ